MNKSISITFAVTAAILLIACGKNVTGKTDIPQNPDSTANTSVTSVNSTEPAETTSPEITSAPQNETTSSAAQSPASTTEATTAENVSVGGGIELPPQPNMYSQEKTHSGSTPPSSSDYNYGPAPIQYDNDGITYIQGVLIANKSYSLPADFNPGLDSTCYSQFEKLSSAAAQEGLNIWLASGFRTYDYQNQIYNNYVSYDGQAAADTYSARPGYSEHQSGLAIDVNDISDSFIGTPEAVWLENHCHEYGFILRYPQGKQDITGYKYESWHIRYVGTDMSYPIHASGLTLEEYFGIDSYYH